MREFVLSSVRENVFELKGEIKALLTNKRAKILLCKENYEAVGDSLIFHAASSIDEFAARIKVLMKFVDGNLTYDSDINGQLLEYKQEEDRFVKFSKDALDIKNNCCKTEDFKEFTSCLSSNMRNRTLYPLQLLSAYHMAFSQNACNFSVPGAGKTSIVYGAYTYLKNMPASDPRHVDKILIVGPLNSFGPWESEYKECFGVIPMCQRINGTLSLEDRKQYFYSNSKELTLISYASVCSVADSIKYFLRNNKTMVVLDEAHKIKNTSGGVTANTVLELSKYATSRVVLTGTPAPNGYDDLLNLFNFIWPKKHLLGYNIAQLRDMTKNPADSRIDVLMKSLDPYYIRIKKSDLGIPDPIDNPPIIVPMKSSQRRIYDFIEQKYISDLSSTDKDIHSNFVKARTIRLMQAATNPALLSYSINEYLDNSSNYNSDPYEDSSILKDVLQYYDYEVPAKFEACLNLCKTIIKRNEKAIIWAVFIKDIDMLHEYLEKNGVRNKILYGATPVATSDMSVEDDEYNKTREAIIKDFHRNDSDFKVIIANPFAVAESISLHKVCHNAIYLERTFNCAHFLQSKDRIHRYGIDKSVETNYYYILSEDSIDSTIDERLKVKEERMLDMIETMPIPLFSNLQEEGREDIKALIRDYARRKNQKI